MKRIQPIEQEAAALIAAAEDVANHYILSSSEHFSSTSQVRTGMEYAYILAGLRMHSIMANDVRDVVFEAMKTKYGMDVETFATSILGG